MLVLIRDRFSELELKPFRNIANTAIHADKTFLPLIISAK